MSTRAPLSILLLVTACSPGQVLLPRAADTKIEGRIPTPSRPSNVLYRDEVESAVKAGLKAFLWKAEVRALTFEDDANVTRFNGYLIVALRPALDWLPFDFAPGDVVTHINGVSLGQHYNAILPLFESLAQASQIDVTLRRDGAERVVRVRIEPRPATP
ncbi:MAG: hypothetical protein QM784_37805 [Polyangiaceae bacterium]